MKETYWRNRWLCSLLWMLCLTCGFAQVKPFKFAQLTDIHLNPNGNGPTEDLQRSVADINALKNVDFVLVTGDLTEQGDRTTLQKVKNCLEKLSVPFYVCLGNHETTWSESGCTAFSEIFGKEYEAFTHKGVQFLLFNSGPLLKMAYGHVSPHVITWAQQQLKEANGMPTIVVTHYPMTEGDVDNWYDVTDALRKPGNVRLFIGGHYHSVRDLKYDGMPGILMRSNLRDKDGLPGYGVYEVSGKTIKAYVKQVGEPMKHVADYAMDHVTYDVDGKAEKYPDFSDNKTFPQVKEEWVANVGPAMYCSPAVEKERVFVGDDEGHVKAYSLRDGKLLWDFETSKRVVGGAAAKSGMVVFGSADHYIYGLNAKTGSLKWKIQTSQPVMGAVAVDGKMAYLGGSDSTFRAIDIKTGRVVWAYHGLRGYVMSRPLVTKQFVIFGAWDNTLYCLDKTTGKVQWKWNGGLTRMHFSPAQVWPVSSNGKVFIVDPQRAMTAIDLRSGETIWRSFQSKVRESIGMSEDGTRVYAKTMDDSVVCYDAIGEKPRELWATAVGFGYEHGPCMLPEKDGVVYGSTKDGMTFALDGRTGKLLWRHKNGNSLMNTVVTLNKKRLLFTNTDGKLGLLRVEK